MRLHDLPLEPLFQDADLAELHDDELAHPDQSDAEDGEGDLDLQEGTPAPPPAYPGTWSAIMTAVEHIRGAHWKFGSMTVPWPACCTDPEKLPSEAMV